MTRYVTYNLLTGGIDRDGSEHRRIRQIELLTELDPRPTFLTVQELTGWHRNGWSRLHQLANALDMVALHPVTSHIGDGENHTALLYRPSRNNRLISYTPGRGRRVLLPRAPARGLQHRRPRHDGAGHTRRPP